MDYKPYTPDHVSNSFDDVVQGAHVDSATTASLQYPANVAFAEVPLGLLKVSSAAPGTSYKVTVQAIYEM